MSRLKHHKGLLAMLGSWLLLAAALLALPVPAEAAAPLDAGKLIVHEWGTFLSVQGPDGVALGGMIESEEDLPPFVRERGLGGLSRASLTSKVETPVTYFYVDRPRTVQVRAEMPKGLLTHWFPMVQSFGPPLKAGRTPAPTGSFLDWGTVHLTPAPRAAANGLIPGLRPVAANSPWRFVRETDSALVKVGPPRPGLSYRTQSEKFLFYRGLGAFDLPLSVQTTEGRCSTTLTLFNRGPEPLSGAFAVQVGKSDIRFTTAPSFQQTCRRGGVNVQLGDPMPLAKGVPEAKRKVADALVKAGLYRKEAEAMVNNWEHSYFRTEGLRVLYLLPRSTVDQTLPIRITPAPQELVRVMVGRVEVLTARTQRSVEAALTNLGSRSLPERAAAEAEIARLGRLKEPVLRRISASSRDATAKAKAAELLKGLVAAKR
jgi:hypothetical protein